ncbi:MAG: hypothetical protein QXL02_01545 [Candidatus Anstonellales archaeon]
MLCDKCASIYNLNGLVEIGENCEICHGIWDRLELRDLPSQRVSIRVIGFDDSKYLLQPRSTLSAAIKEELKSKYNLQIDNTDPDVYIDVSPDGIQIRKAELFIFGRYWKLRNNISQKRWPGKGIPSIEGIIGRELIKIYGGSKYFMHASGREDIDAFNIAGRPFVMEIHEPVRYNVSPGIIQSQGIVAVIYGRVRRIMRTLVSDSHFDKSYICYHKELSDEEISILSSSPVLRISQYTPSRVEHRRALKTRYRKIYRIRAFRNFSYIYAEAGAYIKEFFHGDKGRTSPCISSILNREINCDTLIVSRLYDRFVDILYNRYRLDSFH